jgi:hypothetical protein
MFFPLPQHAIEGSALHCAHRSPRVLHLVVIVLCEIVVHPDEHIRLLHLARIYCGKHQLALSLQPLACLPPTPHPEETTQPQISSKSLLGQCIVSPCVFPLTTGTEAHFPLGYHSCTLPVLSMHLEIQMLLSWARLVAPKNKMT